jgi:hypothetical protein
LEAKRLGGIPSTFSKVVRKVLRDENPDIFPMASRVNSFALPSLIRHFA